ncbi:solute carrier family 22 member 4-like isoform X2 [Denticeps clupeoides]|nr:solute carrier family 22 member 4-like isoform X2 [Denticeps clupeoides]XP_028815466.1 solute carrier family 22 member 4-like isoform X2 [Denticeps clupeoides]XP_028815467.1 solute carrier family 22 member 4-like isoform X2 [Denticeps clupeoides]
MDYDEAISFLGEWGPFQKSVFLLLSLSTVPNGYSGMAMVFLSDTPEHRCRAPYLLDSGANLSQALPTETGADGASRYSRCSRFKWLNGTGAEFSNETEGCLDGWDYSSDRYESTIVTEWDLVCGDAWRVPFSLSIFFMGVLSGSFVSGQISDRFGRKVTLFTTMAVQTLFSLVQVASVNWVMFCSLFFIIGIGQISNYIAAFVLGSELLGSSSRVSFSTLGMCVFYALGYASLPFCAYFTRSWRILLTVLSLPGLLYIPLWWLIPESPRWLLAQGRVEEAEAIVRAAARKNGVTPPAVIFPGKDPLLLKSSTTSYTFLDLIRTTKMRNVTILNSAMWFVITISYFGLSLSTPNMNGDPYLNCFLSAVMEIAAYFGAWLLLKVVTRKTVITSTLLAGGGVLLLVHFVPQSMRPETPRPCGPHHEPVLLFLQPSTSVLLSPSEDCSVLSVVLAMAAKFGITAAFSVLYISAVEQFPTVVRGMGLGICSMSSKIGSTISPFFPYIGVYDNTLPYILMGLLTVVAGLLSILIPETRDSPLPDDITQVQKINWVCCTSKTRTEKASLS